jgi:hypothetical protein
MKAKHPAGRVGSIELLGKPTHLQHGWSPLLLGSGDAFN